jgi:hypothetical protein
MEKKDNSIDENNKPIDEEIVVGGYGYWKREGDLKDNEKFIPKVVSNSNDVKVEENKISVGSVWNTAGTWEEKHYNKKQIEEFFNTTLSKKEFTGFIIQSISGYSGDVSLVYHLYTNKMYI